MRPSTFRVSPHRRPIRGSLRPSCCLTLRRRGRVLVECCVAMVLLAGAGALMLLVTANTAHLVDESRQRDLVMRAASVRLSPALTTPCLVAGAALRESVGPRAVLDIVAHSERMVHTVSVDASWQTSGFAGNRWHRRTTTVSGWCE